MNERPFVFREQKKNWTLSDECGVLFLYEWTRIGCCFFSLNLYRSHTHTHAHTPISLCSYSYPGLPYNIMVVDHPV